MTDEKPALHIGRTLAEADEQFNPGRKEARDLANAERLAWLDAEQAQVQAGGVELKKQLHQHILDHMPMPERPS